MTDSGPFLNYSAVDIHFVYGFLWEDPSCLRNTVFEGDFQSDGGWSSVLLHERVIPPWDQAGPAWTASYQPSFELLIRSLEKTGDLGELLPSATAVYLFVPGSHSTKLPGGSSTVQPGGRVASCDGAIYPIRLRWTLRLFNTGSGTLTLRIAIDDAISKVENSTKFGILHSALRLIPNVDNFPEGHAECINPNDSNGTIADAFIFLQGIGTCRLFEVARTVKRIVLRTLPPGFFCSGKNKIDAEDPELVPNHASATEDHIILRTDYNPHKLECNWGENQTPYLLINATVDAASMARLAVPSLRTVQEVTSILARATLDVRSAAKDFNRITLDYLQRAVDLIEHPNLGHRLRNWSHDANLFYTFSKRGAITVSADPAKAPATFVVPSLLNLFELLRGRQYAAVVIGCRLTSFARAVSLMDPAGDSELDLQKYLQLRRLVIMNLHDQSKVLFDGGAITELSLAADSSLGVSAAWQEIRHTFDVLDRLMTAWENARFKMRYR